MQFSVIKNGLIAHDDEARAALSKMKIGAVVDVEVLNPIHTKFNAKIFAAIGALAKATGVTTDEMKTRLLVLTGRFHMVPTAPHKKALVVDSMSRSAMTQSERESFWDDMREVANEQILPLLDDHAADDIRSMFADRQTTEAGHESAKP